MSSRLWTWLDTTGMVTGLEFESGQAEVTVDKQVEVRTSDIVKVL
jgi:hypothetical protein